MKKLFKPIMLFTMISALLLSCTSSVFAVGMTAKELAKAVLYGENYNENVYAYNVKGSEPVIAKVNPDNPDELNDGCHDFQFWYKCSKQDFINKLIEITNTDIAKVRGDNTKYDSNRGIIFDEPNTSGCTKCPARALERAKGTFYQDYVYDYWKQYTEAYAADVGHNIPSVEKFFTTEGIPLNNVVPKATPTPTPIPTTPPKAIERINSIKREQNVENTLYVFNTDGILTLAVNGEIVKFPDVQPFIDANSRTQIPVRAVAETLKCDVNWDGKISTAIINGNGKLITVTIGEYDITINGVNKPMDTCAMLKDDRTCVPLRAIAEALGLTVKYEKV